MSIDKILEQDIIKKIYSDLSWYLLRLLMLNYKDVIIFDLYSENVFDIDKIPRKVESFRGVNKAEVFQPLDIRWPQDWLLKEIDERLKKDGKIYR